MIDHPNPYKTSLSSSSPEGLQNPRGWQNLDDLKKQRQEMIDHPNPAALADELAAEIGRLKAEARHASDCLEAAQAEIERLTKLNDAMVKVLTIKDLYPVDGLPTAAGCRFKRRTQ